MAINVTHDTKTGRWSFSYKRHVLVAVGLLFIGAGLATFTGPWWQGILIALLGKADITVPESSIWISGTVLVLIGFGFIGYKYLVIDVRDREISADRSMLSSAPVPIDSVRSYLDWLINDHSFKSSLDTAFYNSYTYFQKSENKFRQHALAQAYEAYALPAKNLHTFCANNFFVFPDTPPPDGDYRYCLAPSLNIDRGMTVYDGERAAQYDDLARVLSSHVTETQRSFENFVQALKRQGHV